MPLKDKKKRNDKQESQEDSKIDLKKCIIALEALSVAPSFKSTRAIPSLWNKLSYSQKLTAYNKITELKLKSTQSPFIECIGLQTINIQAQLEKDMLKRLHSDDAYLGTITETRLITIHPDSIKDAEVRDGIYLQLLKHDPKTCLIRTSLEGIMDVFHSQPTLKTLVPIGHGFTPQKQVIFSCGPIQGVHNEVAKQWSDILKFAPQVKHLRLVFCYYGSTNPSFDERTYGQIKYKEDKKHRLEHGTMSAIVSYSPLEPLPNPQPFTALKSTIFCWN